MKMIYIFIKHNNLCKCASVNLIRWYSVNYMRKLKKNILGVTKKFSCGYVYWCNHLSFCLNCAWVQTWCGYQKILRECYILFIDESRILSLSLECHDISRYHFSHFEWRHRLNTWWRHQMETFSALLAICAGNSPVPGEFPAQRPVTRSFDVFLDLRLNKRYSKQSWGWRFETLSRSLWRHRNEFDTESLIVRENWKNNVWLFRHHFTCLGIALNVVCYQNGH